MGKSEPRRTSSINIVISRGLRIGVALSGILVAVGAILYYATGDAGFPAGRVSLLWVFTSFLSLNPAAVIFLGVLVLIATPVVRVLIAGYAFFRGRDLLYTFVAALVFVILVVSFLIANE